MSFITLVYGYQKLGVFLDKKDISIMKSTKDLYFTDDDIYSYDEGLNVAIAFTGYDSEQEWILDPSYGALSIDAYSWGSDENGDPFTKREPMTQSNCTRE